MGDLRLVIATSSVGGPAELAEYLRRHEEVPDEVIADAQRAGVRAACVAHHGMDLFLAMVVPRGFTLDSLAASPAGPVTASWNADMGALLQSADRSGRPWREAATVQQWSTLHWRQ